MLHPEVLWAQRSSATDDAKNVVYLTINTPDINEATLKYDLTPTSISFSTKTGNPEKGIPEKEFAFDLQFFDEVVPEDSIKRLSTRSLYLVLRKKENKEEYWPRLTKEKVKNAFIKTDFSKWVDEDEQDGAAVVEEEDPAMSGPPGMGMPGMGMPGMGMPGMPGMGGFGGGPGGGDMDFQKMMAQMGMGGDGGFGGGPGGLGGGSGAGDDDDDSDEDDDGPPPLEDAEPTK
ncbi:HSP20-like chaperone [Mycena floridula]|nr:HSP20-like chaperone [Mycena floridula]